MPGIAGAPSVFEDQVYTGAADGTVYELKLSDGKSYSTIFSGFSSTCNTSSESTFDYCSNKQWHCELRDP